MEDLTDVWGDPREYKGIKIYPVKMRDCIEFYKNVGCLLYDKNKIPDVKIIKMSYLRFLVELAYSLDEKGDNHNYILTNLRKLLNIVFKEDVHFFGENNQIFIAIKDTVLTESDFEKIRKIICKQNLIRLDNEILDSEVARLLQEAREFLAKKQGATATLEEQIIILFCLSGLPMEQIKELTIYQFNKMLERYAIIKNFEVFSSVLAEYGKGNEIKHFMAHIEERSLLEDVTMSREEFNQITSDSTVFGKK